MRTYVIEKTFMYLISKTLDIQKIDLRNNTQNMILKKDEHFTLENWYTYYG